jgi:hypothetical protein
MSAPPSTSLLPRTCSKGGRAGGRAGGQRRWLEARAAAQQVEGAVAGGPGRVRTSTTRAMLSPMGAGRCGLRVASTPMVAPSSLGTCGGSSSSGQRRLRGRLGRGGQAAAASQLSLQAAGGGAELQLQPLRAPHLDLGLDRRPAAWLQHLEHVCAAGGRGRRAGPRPLGCCQLPRGRLAPDKQQPSQASVNSQRNTASATQPAQHSQRNTACRSPVFLWKMYSTHTWLYCISPSSALLGMSECSVSTARASVTSSGCRGVPFLRAGGRASAWQQVRRRRRRRRRCSAGAGPARAPARTWW